MQKYKVLNIITGGLKSDGITTSWLSFCKEFNKEIINIPFTMDFASIDELSFASIEKKFIDEGFITPRLPPRYYSPFKYAIRLYKLLKDRQYDIIHVNGSSSLMIIEILIGWFAGVKVRISHSRNTSCHHNLINFMFKGLFNRLCNGKIACGKDAGEWLFGNHQYDIIYNGKDLNRFSYDLKYREDIRKKIEIENKFVIGHVGRFNNQKNHPFLIDVFEETLKKIPQSVLMLIGEGPLEGQVRDLVNSKNLSDKVIFTGAVDNVQDYLQGVDIMVFPSKYEGLPNVVLEWQAMGIPSVISDKITDECIVSDFVKMENIDGTVDEWVNSIIDLYKKYPNRQKNAEEGTKALRINGFDIQSSVSNLINIYNNLLSRQRNRISLTE